MGQKIILREVDLKNKPEAMLKASPKGTVPVLILPGNKVIDESLDIMRWAIEEMGSNILPEADQKVIFSLIEENDTSFKYNLDRYKYPNRYEDISASDAQTACTAFLEKLETQLEKNDYLASNHLTLADYAIFPFIRQFAGVDREWFESEKSLSRLKKWLVSLLNSEIFSSVMNKHKPWAPGQENIYL
jgi:glutathione S-transferase